MVGWKGDAMYDTFNRIEAGQWEEQLRSLPALYRAGRCATCEGPKPCAVTCPEGVDVALLVRQVAEAVRQGRLPADWFASESDRADAYIADCLWNSYNIN